MADSRDSETQTEEREQVSSEAIEQIKVQIGNLEKGMNQQLVAIKGQLADISGESKHGCTQMRNEENPPPNLLAIPTPTSENCPPRHSDNLHGNVGDQRNPEQLPVRQPPNQAEGGIRVEPPQEEEGHLIQDAEVPNQEHRLQADVPANRRCSCKVLLILALTILLLASIVINIHLASVLLQCRKDVPIFRVDNDLHQCYNVTGLKIETTDEKRVFRVQVSARSEFYRDMEQERRLRQQLADAELVIKRHLQKSICKVYFNGKCFWAVLRNGIKFTDGESICAEVVGGKPAIFYSEKHYGLVLEHIRSLTTYTSVWLGLEINPPTKEVVTIPWRSPAPFVKWHYSYPSSGMRSTGVRLQVVRDPENTGTGMYNNNNRLTDTAHGVLCEA